MSPYYMVGFSRMLSLHPLHNASGNVSDCPDGNQFIWEYFEQCIHTPLQWVSFGLGLGSIGFWLGVLLPQIIENFKDMQCVGSISAGLLFSWIFGDSMNLVGAVLTKQGLVQVLLGVWFLLTDMIIMSQLIFYHCVYKRRNRSAKTGDESKRLLVCVVGMLCMTAMFSGLRDPMAPEPDFRAGSGRRLLSTDLLGSQQFFHSSQELIGYILGIVSSLAYFASRTFQIYKNVKFRKVQGLSVVTFAMAVLGNLLYGLAIVLYSVERRYSLMHLPWLVGSWGIMFMDFVIVYQIKTYARESDQTILVEDPVDEVVPELNGDQGHRINGYGTLPQNRPLV